MDARRFALRVKLNKLEHEAVFIQALLCDILKKQGQEYEVVDGCCTVYGSSCWHVWLEDKHGNQIDIHRMIFKEFDIPGFTLTREHIKDAEKDQSTVDLFELYKTDKRAFWKKATKDFLEFKSKCLSSIK